MLHNNFISLSKNIQVLLYFPTDDLICQRKSYALLFACVSYIVYIVVMHSLFIVHVYICK